MNDKLPLECGTTASCSDPSPGSCPGGDAHDCALSCADVCALHPGEKAAPIVLAEALASFEREAVQGACDTGRYRLPYYTWGEGPPLLFVHGVGDSCRSFIQPISRLSAHFRCIAYDLPSGFRDGARLRRYSHDDLVADLWALLDHLGVPSELYPWLVVRRNDRLEGDARSASEPTARHPARRTGVSTAAVRGAVPGVLGAIPARLDGGIAETREGAAQGHRAARSRSCSPTYGIISSTVRDARLAAFACQAYMLHGLDVRPLLPAVRQPVLLICGDQDRVVPRPYEEMLLQGLPNAGRVVIEGCGHVPSYTHPEVLAEVIRQFLTPPAK